MPGQVEQHECWKSPLGRFMRLALDSRLLSHNALREMVQTLEREHPYVGTDAVGVATLCKQLEQHELLTPWQCEKLRSGRWKGSYLAEFAILNHVRYDEACHIYLAKNVRTEQMVHLHITPQSAPDPPGSFRTFESIRYRVKEIAP